MFCHKQVSMSSPMKARQASFAPSECPQLFSTCPFVRFNLLPSTQLPPFSDFSAKGPRQKKSDNHLWGPANASFGEVLMRQSDASLAPSIASGKRFVEQMDTPTHLSKGVLTFQCLVSSETERWIAVFDVTSKAGPKTQLKMRSVACRAYTRAWQDFIAVALKHIACCLCFLKEPHFTTRKTIAG